MNIIEKISYMIKNNPETYSKEFPDMMQAYSNAVLAEKHRLGFPLSPENWEFPKIKVDLNNNKPDFFYNEGMSFCYTENTIYIKPSLAISKDKLDLQRRFTDIARTSLCFPKAQRAYELVRNDFFINLYKFPAQKNWNFPELSIPEAPSTTGRVYNTKNNSIIITKSDAQNLEGNQLYALISHEATHSLKKDNNTLRKIIHHDNSKLTLFSLSLVTPILSYIATKDTDLVIETALYSTLAIATHFMASTCINPTKREMHKIEHECDLSVLNSDNPSNTLGAISLLIKSALERSGDIGEYLPKITNLKEAISACAKLYLTRPARENAPSKLSITRLLEYRSPNKTHPITPKRIRLLIEGLKEQENTTPAR